MSNPAARLLCFVLLGIGLSVSPASAGAIVLTQASLDWSGFFYTIEGGLIVDSVEPAGDKSSNSFAQTPMGGANSVAGLISAASSTSAIGGAGAQAFSSTNNGLLNSTSQSSTLGDTTARLQADGDAAAFTNFWLYGHGSGRLTVSVPFTLRIGVDADPPPAGVFRDDYVRSAASVSLFLGPGAGPAGEQWFDSVALAWLPSDPVIDGLITRTGTLSVSRSLVNPTFGPLISLGAIVRTDALAAVPEPGMLELMGLASLALVSMFLRRDRTRAA